VFYGAPLIVTRHGGLSSLLMMNYFRLILTRVGLFFGPWWPAMIALS
jgi:hypothetical protein